jgi:hypothetical protein
VLVVLLAVVTLGIGGLLIAGHGLLELVPVGALAGAASLVSLWAESRRKARSVAMEALAMLALSLAAPAAAVTTRSGLGSVAVGLWLLAALFFLGSIPRVRYLVKERRLRSGPLPQRIRAAWPSVLFHLAGLVVLLVLAQRGQLTWTPALAFVPVLLYVLWNVTARSTRGVSVRQVGFTELGLTAVVVALGLVSS